MTESHFRVDLSSDKDKPEWKEDWELFHRLNEALRHTGEVKYGKPMTIFDLANNSNKVQFEVLSDLAGQKVYAWKLLPGMREIHHAKRCPAYHECEAMCPQGVGA